MGHLIEYRNHLACKLKMLKVVGVITIAIMISWLLIYMYGDSVFGRYTGDVKVGGMIWLFFASIYSMIAYGGNPEYQRRLGRATIASSLMGAFN